MLRRQRAWTLRRALGTVEVELYPGSADAAAREASLRELRRLMYDFKYRDPEARRVVLAVYAELQGLPATAAFRGEHDLDTGSARADAIGEELVSAARAGKLVAVRREPRSVVVPLDGPDQDVLGPDSSEAPGPASKTWIGLVLVDQDGVPVPNRPYRVVCPDGTTVDGTLDSNATAFVRNLDPGNCQIWCPYVEPHTQLTYPVQQGDHVSGVAESNGFDDYNVVWNDPGNADLQSLRSDPHVLAPGDVLTIPELNSPPANKPTGAKHPFTVKRTPFKVRIKVLDRAAKPMAGVPVTVDGSALTSDGTGLVETAIDKTAQALPMTDPDTTFQLAVGAINPADDATDAGYKARLFNLGFLWDPTVADTDDEMIIALQDFQAEYALTVSGQLDDATKAQLSQTYGS